MSLSKVSPFYSSAPSMFTDSQPKTGTDSVPVYIDFGSNPKRFGRFTVSQIFKNGQNYSEPTFQVFKKDNSGTFEKYQQLRIGDYEFKKFCFLKNNILDGELELSEHPTQSWNGYQWSFLTNIELKKEEYENLLEHLPTLLSYLEKLMFLGTFNWINLLCLY